MKDSVEAVDEFKLVINIRNNVGYFVTENGDGLLVDVTLATEDNM